MSLYPILGAAFVAAGADKASGDAGYEGMFRHLGWSHAGMRNVAIAEIAGGALLIPGPSRRLGAGILAVTSAAVLTTELSRNEVRLAAPRALLLLATLSALLFPRRG